MIVFKRISIPSHISLIRRYASGKKLVEMKQDEKTGKLIEENQLAFKSLHDFNEF